MYTEYVTDVEKLAHKCKSEEPQDLKTHETIYKHFSVMNSDISILIPGT